ncbi:hypothetical protein PIB30_108946, partial [Stylosanthes scabra]|nr:hypothetical protein [Stylosanthes scabra]
LSIVIYLKESNRILFDPHFSVGTISTHRVILLDPVHLPESLFCLKKEEGFRAITPLTLTPCYHAILTRSFPPSHTTPTASYTKPQHDHNVTILVLKRDSPTSPFNPTISYHPRICVHSYAYAWDSHPLTTDQHP